MADKENRPPTPASGSPIAIGLRPWQNPAFTSPPLRAISPNSRPTLNRQRDHSACGRLETPLKVRKTRENLRDTKTYPNIPPPCAHLLPHEKDSLQCGSNSIISTLPCFTDDQSMPPPPQALQVMPKIQRHTSVSRRMLSKVKQGINSRSKATLSIRPTESETSLMRRISGRRKQSVEMDRRAQSFEISRDSIASALEDDAVASLTGAENGARSFTDSTISTSHLMEDLPVTPSQVSWEVTSGGAVLSRPITPANPITTDHPSADPTPRPSSPLLQQSAPLKALRFIVPCVELAVAMDQSTVDANHEQHVWISIEAKVSGKRFPVLPTSCDENLSSDGAAAGVQEVLGAITSLRLCYKPVGGCTILELVGQKAMKNISIGRSCALFVKMSVPRLQSGTQRVSSDSATLFTELESMVGILETELLHVEARYRTSLLPHDNVVTIRHVAKLRRPRSDSRWSIVGAYSDMDVSEQMHTKLAIYLADSYSPDRALKYIDRYLSAEAQREGPVRQIRQKLVDDFLFSNSHQEDSQPAVIITDVDTTAGMARGPASEKFATAWCTPKMGSEPATMVAALMTSPPQPRTRSVSLSAMKLLQPRTEATLSTSTLNAAMATAIPGAPVDSEDDARRLWHHLRRSSLSSRQLAEMTPEKLRHLEASDENLLELRRKALANKRSVGAETLREWKWQGQADRVAEAPWL